MNFYLSWSKLSLFETDKDKFYKVYIEGEYEEPNKYMVFGKKLSSAIQEDKYTDDEILNSLKDKLIKYDEIEYKIFVDFSNMKLFGIFDTFDTKRKIFREYKTGKNWSKSRVDKEGQLTFYAMLVYLKFNLIPEKIYLDWAETIEDENGEIKLTGKLTSFETNRNIEDIVLMIKRCKKAYEEMSKFYELKL